MRGGIWMSLSLLVLSACAGQNIEPAEAELSCLPYANTDQVLAYGKSHVIMLGEFHGTNESPEALEQLVCAALQTGETVRVGLEANWSQGIALNEAATLPVDRAAMLEAAPMMWGAHDGRSSVATFELLEQIATWKAAGHDVSVFAFDGEPSEWIKEDGTGSPRDETMARQVDLNLKNFDGVTVLLAGSFHVRKTAFSFGDEAYVPMATHVTERPVFSLRLKHGPGEFWINGSVSGEDGTMVEFIGPYETRGNADEDTVVRQFDLQPSEDGFLTGITIQAQSARLRPHSLILPSSRRRVPDICGAISGMTRGGCHLWAKIVLPFGNVCISKWFRLAFARGLIDRYSAQTFY